MGRIRTIKPELPLSENLGRCSRDARLLFILLWTFADDSGRARAASRMLASHLFPFDDDAPGKIEKWLTELETNDCIRRYEADGSHYLEVIKWQEHQRIDRPSPSRLPANSAKDREGSRKIAKARASYLGPRTIGPRTIESGAGAPPTQETRIETISNPQSLSSRGCRVPADFEPDARCQRLAESLAVSADAFSTELEKFRDYWCSQPGQRGVKTDWHATFRNWLRKSSEYKGNNNGKTPGNRAATFAQLDAVVDEAERREREGGGGGGKNPTERAPGDDG